MKTIYVFLISIFLSTAMYISAQQKDPAAVVQEVLNRSARAFAQNDLKTLEKTWANDDSVIVYESGYANYGWADYRDNHLVPEMKEMKNTEYELSDIRAHVSGNTAWATFKYRISADHQGKHVSGVGLGTAVLEQKSNQWKIVHWHSSSPPRKPQQPQTQSESH